MDAMWFYDDTDDLEELQTFRKQAQELDQKHLEIRVALQDAEAALRGNPGNADLKSQIEDLKKRLEELNRQAPWLCSDVPIEILLWGVPHG